MDLENDCKVLASIVSNDTDDDNHADTDKEIKKIDRINHRNSIYNKKL